MSSKSGKRGKRKLASKQPFNMKMPLEPLTENAQCSYTVVPSPPPSPGSDPARTSNVGTAETFGSSGGVGTSAVNSAADSDLSIDQPPAPTAATEAPTTAVVRQPVVTVLTMQQLQEQIAELQTQNTELQTQNLQLAAELRRCSCCMS
jgi:hypothetical protein